MSHRDRASSHVMTWKSGGGVLQSSAVMTSIPGGHRHLTVQSVQLRRLVNLNGWAELVGGCGT